MATIEQSIDVDVSVSTAYQLDDTHLHWLVSHQGKRHEFDAEISDQRPDDRMAWRTTDGTSHAGTVTFKPLDGARCTVTVEMDWQPERTLEELGAAIGSDDRRVKADLESFKGDDRESRRRIGSMARDGRTRREPLRVFRISGSVDEQDLVVAPS